MGNRINRNGEGMSVEGQDWVFLSPTMFPLLAIVVYPHSEDIFCKAIKETSFLVLLVVSIICNAVVFFDLLRYSNMKNEPCSEVKWHQFLNVGMMLH